MIDVEEDSGLAPSNNALTELSGLAMRQLDLEAEIAELEAEMSSKMSELRTVSEKEIPAAMTAAGVKQFVMSSPDPKRNGASIAIKEDVSISLAGPVKVSVIAWLKENNHGDVVSNEFIVKIPRGYDATKVETIRTAVADTGLNLKEEENVNTATFKALYKEQVAKGVTLDPKEFGAYHYTKTVITLPSEKKPSRSKKK